MELCCLPPFLGTCGSWLSRGCRRGGSGGSSVELLSSGSFRATAAPAPASLGNLEVLYRSRPVFTAPLADGDDGVWGAAMASSTGLLDGGRRCWRSSPTRSDGGGGSEVQGAWGCSPADAPQWRRPCRSRRGTSSARKATSAMACLWIKASWLPVSSASSGCGRRRRALASSMQRLQGTCFFFLFLGSFVLLCWDRCPP